MIGIEGKGDLTPTTALGSKAECPLSAWRERLRTFPTRLPAATLRAGSFPTFGAVSKAFGCLRRNSKPRSLCPSGLKKGYFMKRNHAVAGGLQSGQGVRFVRLSACRGLGGLIFAALASNRAPSLAVGQVIPCGSPGHAQGRGAGPLNMSLLRQAQDERVECGNSAIGVRPHGQED